MRSRCPATLGPLHCTRETEHAPDAGCVYVSASSAPDEKAEAERLVEDAPVLRAAIALRNPYVDPLSLLQIALMEKKRALPEDAPDRRRVGDALATTLSGIAQGLRNTG